MKIFTIIGLKQSGDEVMLSSDVLYDKTAPWQLKDKFIGWQLGLL